MSDIILHHYPQSPVAEKVRTALGLKSLAWSSVIIPRLPPKPDLMPLTGGYRNTPVMQIGADVYCDSHRILAELDRRHPEPTFYPGGGHGMPWAVGAWTGGPLFTDTIALIMGDSVDDMSPDFINDRGTLYFGPDHDFQDLKRRIPETLAQLRGQLGWINTRLTARDFMLGAEPGLPDIFCYYIVWFIRGRYSEGPDFLAQFENICAWEQRIQAWGHGTPKDLDPQAALDMAKEAMPAAEACIDPLDPQSDLGAGCPVTVTPSGGGVSVSGALLRLDGDDVSIARTDPRVGDVVVHFPRVGYRVARQA